MMEDFETNVREFWGKKALLAWETTEDFAIDVLSNDFHVDFEDGSEAGLIRMAKRMSSVYEAATRGELAWAVAALKAEEGDPPAAHAIPEASDDEEEGGSGGAADGDGWTTVTAKSKGH